MNLESDWGRSRGAGGAKMQRLADEDVAEILGRLAEGERTDLIAERFGICPQYVCKIRQGARRVKV